MVGSSAKKTKADSVSSKTTSSNILAFSLFHSPLMSLVLVNISLQAREHFACLMHANKSSGKDYKKECITVVSVFISLRVWMVLKIENNDNISGDNNRSSDQYDKMCCRSLPFKTTFIDLMPLSGQQHLSVPSKTVTNGR